MRTAPTPGGEYNFIFDELIRAIDFPIIESDAQDVEIKASRNIDIDTTLPKSDRDAYVRSLIADMDKINRPIVVSYQDTIILSRVHYGESSSSRDCGGFRTSRSSSPPFLFLSATSASATSNGANRAISGWEWRAKPHISWGHPFEHDGLDRDPETPPQPESKVTETIAEMENDLLRLNKIADRFSKIGSKPDLREEDLNDVVKGVTRLFPEEDPQMGKKVEIVVEPGEEVRAKINRELFEWVLENLVKNGLDAMEDGKGKISFRISKLNGAPVIDVTDTGKGIDAAYRKDIFRPGFSTKKRGWGLGLSLSKRIVETYHRGKLSVKESKLGVGTTFRIKLRP